MSNNKITETNIIGNASTIVKYILIMIATKTLALAAAHGYNLPVDATQLAEILGYILGFIIATIDAKWPNNFFNNIFELGIAKINEIENSPENNTDNGDGDDE